MKLFGKKKEEPLTGAQQRIAETVAGRITRAQRRCADYLNSRTGSLSKTTWQLILLILCVLMGGYSLYLVIAAFN